MTPWQKAEQWHNEHDATKSFAELVGEYLGSAYVYSSPQLFCLARELHWDEDTQSFSHAEPNCWFVHLAAGTGSLHPVREFLRMAPVKHKYAAWCRRNNSFEPRVYLMEKLMKKAGGQ